MEEAALGIEEDVKECVTQEETLRVRIEEIVGRVRQ